VAIVQISRITNRKGLQEDLPQPLAGAELGWAIDSRQLFIGNGELAEGAPVIGNTEILTEFSDILGLATVYTYQGAAGGYTVQTGPSVGTPVSQSLQSRLDSYAVVTDFGAIGDGVTDCTAAINRALFQLYCRQINPAIRRSLFFPAGTYLITGTINVPPYCMLYGEGAESSILNFQINEWSTLASYQTGVLVQVTSAGPSYAYYRSIAEVPTGISISNPLYWAAESLPGYVMRTADSLQQTGANIGTNGATPPTNISVSGMKLTTNKVMDGLLIQNAVNCEFVNMAFEGPRTTSDLATAANPTVAVAWASTTSLVCTHVNIDNCIFSGFTYGTNTAQQIKGCVISNSYFDTLYQGVYLGGVTPVNGGPTGTKLLHNTFDNVYIEGIVIDGVSLNASGYNVFYDVGNHFLGITQPASSIIDIDTANNLSIGDMFQRTDAYATTYPRIQLNNTASIGLTNASELALGTYVRQTGLRTELPNSTSNATLFTSSATTARAFKMEYTAIKNAANVRTGVFTVVSSTDGTGGNLIYDDSGFQNSDTGLTLVATETGSNVTVKYSTTAGANVFLNYSVTKLA
jgi:hypothetical protein